MFIETVVTRAMLSSNAIASSVGTALYKNADKILLGVGVGCIGAGTVSACVKTKTIAGIKELHRRRLEEAEAIEDKKERGKAKLDVYKNTTLDILMTFGPCVLLTGTGIMAILGSHYILSRRFASLQVAYSMLDNSYREYRERVKDAIGAKKEHDLFTNTSEIEVFEDKGNGKGVKKSKVKNINGNKNPYCFIFDESNPNWQKNPALNKVFLEQRQWYANDLLHHKKVVTLAEILFSLDFYDDMRDIPSYCYDMVWQLGGDGDNEIIFGFQEDEGFMAGHDPSVMLNFNCDGLLRKIRHEDQPVLATQKSEVA